MTTRVDLDALLVALVLAPATYSRNRFFELFVAPEARRVRRRAALVRSVLRHAREMTPGALEALAGARPADGGAVELRYVVASLGLTRTVRLEPLERALVRFAVALGTEHATAEDDPDRARIESALRRLSGAGPDPDDSQLSADPA